MTQFIDVIKLWAETAPKGELLAIKEYFNTSFILGDLSITTSEIRKTDGLLSAVKYVKFSTGWGLKESKEYVESLLAPSLDIECFKSPTSKHVYTLLPDQPYCKYCYESN